MKKLDKRMKPVIEISSALMMYAAKEWKVKFDTQLDKLDINKLSGYKFGGGYAEFRYDGFLYKIISDRITYRSLNSVDEYILKKEKFSEIVFEN